MPNAISARILLCAGAIAAVAAGSMFAASRSSSAMADAASRLLNSLTPEQRQQAAFAFNADERLHWHFVPTETFPRQGLLVRSMTEPQRTRLFRQMESYIEGLERRDFIPSPGMHCFSCEFFNECRAWQ